MQPVRGVELEDSVVGAPGPRPAARPARQELLALGGVLPFDLRDRLELLVVVLPKLGRAVNVERLVRHGDRLAVDGIHAHCRARTHRVRVVLLVGPRADLGRRPSACIVRVVVGGVVGVNAVVVAVEDAAEVVLDITLRLPVERVGVVEAVRLAKRLRHRPWVDPDEALGRAVRRVVEEQRRRLRVAELEAERIRRPL